MDEQPITLIIIPYITAGPSKVTGTFDDEKTTPKASTAHFAMDPKFGTGYENIFGKKKDPTIN